MSNALVWLDRVMRNSSHAGYVLWIRNAAGYSGPHVIHANSALSSEECDLSKAFGALLKRQLSGVVSAPYGGSMETARCILEGAEIRGAAPDVDPEFGDPSIYVENLELAMKEIRNSPPAIGREALLTGILRARAPWVTGNPKAAAQMLQAKLTARIQSGKVALVVTPSVAIAATVGFALGKEASIQHADCPGPLEGAVFSRSEDGGVWIQMGYHSGRSVL